MHLRLFLFCALTACTALPAIFLSLLFSLATFHISPTNLPHAAHWPLLCVCCTCLSLPILQWACAPPLYATGRLFLPPARRLPDSLPVWAALPCEWQHYHSLSTSPNQRAFPCPPVSHSFATCLSSPCLSACSCYYPFTALPVPACLHWFSPLSSFFHCLTTTPLIYQTGC